MAKQGKKSQTKTNSSDANEETTHPIATAIDNYTHAIRDNMSAYVISVPECLKVMRKQLTDTGKDLRRAAKLLKSDDHADEIQGLKLYERGLLKHERTEHSRIYESVAHYLFVGLFSQFDAFTGDLLKIIYLRKPELFHKIEASISFASVLQHKDIEELKNNILNSEIENFRRMSYVDQFKELESTFSLPLRKFERWPQFVEASQRRNLLVHCDGVISKQYIKVCSDNGFKLDEAWIEGYRFEPDIKYFLSTAELLMEVGVKLGQTLWRKVLPDEIELADKHLTDVVYRNLKIERWKRAKLYAEFMLDQKHDMKDVVRKIIIVNHAIAMKFDGAGEEAKKLLAETDWSGSLPEFKLAEAVLLEKYDEAVEWMRRIGKKGELLEEISYHIWPLFRDFRVTEVFLKTYEEIYECSYIAEVQKNVRKVKGDLAAKPEEQKKE